MQAPILIETNSMGIRPLTTFKYLHLWTKLGAILGEKDTILHQEEWQNLIVNLNLNQKFIF